MHRKPAAWGRGGSRGGRGRQFGLQPIGLNPAVDRPRDSQPVSYEFWGILMDFREFPWAHKNPLRCMKIRPGWRTSARAQPGRISVHLNGF